MYMHVLKTHSDQNQYYTTRRQTPSSLPRLMALNVRSSASSSPSHSVTQLGKQSVESASLSQSVQSLSIPICVGALGAPPSASLWSYPLVPGHQRMLPTLPLLLVLTSLPPHPVRHSSGLRVPTGSPGVADPGGVGRTRSQLDRHIWKNSPPTSTRTNASPGACFCRWSNRCLQCLLQCL